MDYKIISFEIIQFCQVIFFIDKILIKINYIKNIFSAVNMEHL